MEVVDTALGWIEGREEQRTYLSQTWEKSKIKIMLLNTCFSLGQIWEWTSKGVPLESRFKWVFSQLVKEKNFFSNSGGCRQNLTDFEWLKQHFLKGSNKAHMLLAYNLRQGKKLLKKNLLYQLRTVLELWNMNQKKFVSSLKVSFNTFTLARNRSLEIKGQIVKANMSGYSAE